MKTLRTLKITFIYFIFSSFLVSTLLGCVKYKPTPQLDFFNSNIINISGKPVNGFKGAFCGSQDFHKIFSEKKEPGARVSIVLEPKNKGFRDHSRYITTIFFELDETNNTTGYPFTVQDMSKFPQYAQECGLGNKYPHMYWFEMDLRTGYYENGGENIQIDEYKNISNQLNKNKFLDLRVIRVPHFSIAESTIGSEHDARFYFTDQQVKTLLSE